MKLISAKYLADQWIKYAKNEPIYSPNDVLESIDSQPYFDVEPITHAFWEDNGHGELYCSACHNLAAMDYHGIHCILDRRCRSCGAIMDEVV